MFNYRIGQYKCISLVGMIINVEVLVEKITCPTDLMILACSQDIFVILYLVDLSYTHIKGAEIINLKKGVH
jgi:hypothetical protein